jgi:hypothetical protein
MFMVLAAAHSLTDRFAWLFDGLCKAIGVDAHSQRMEAALAWAIWNRVRLLGDRLIALAERVRAGRLPARRKSTPRPGALPQRERETRRSVVEAVRLPRGFGWVGRLLQEAAKYAGALQYMLRDPEMAALVEKAPQAGSMLRPLCHLLGVRPPGFLRRGGVVAQEMPTPLAVEAPAGELMEPISEPEPERLPSADAAVDPPAAEIAPATHSPPPRSAEEAALAYARRPGGLYWDGTGLR